MVWEAAKALEQLHAQSAAPTLLRVLKRDDAVKQSAAAWLLGLLGVRGTISSLKNAAFDSELGIEVRGHAVEALGVMRADEAVPDLITLLSDVSPELRYWAAFALGQIGDPQSIPALEQMASTDVAVLPKDRSLKNEALDALAAIRARQKDKLPR